MVRTTIRSDSSVANKLDSHEGVEKLDSDEAVQPIVSRLHTSPMAPITPGTSFNRVAPMTAPIGRPPVPVGPVPTHVYGALPTLWEGLYEESVGDLPSSHQPQTIIRKPLRASRGGTHSSWRTGGRARSRSIQMKIYPDEQKRRDELMDALFAPDPVTKEVDVNEDSHKQVALGEDGEPVVDEFAYVDENRCIGCKLCATVARSTFYMEPENGRARSFQHGVDSKDVVDEAIDCCPVDCIDYVTYEALEMLENLRAGQVINNKARLVQGDGAAIKGDELSGEMARILYEMRGRPRKEDVQEEDPNVLIDWDNQGVDLDNLDIDPNLIEEGPVIDWEGQGFDFDA